MANVKFFITVDVEEDNSWDKNTELKTTNASNMYIFQEICEKHNFRPIYLLTYEMLKNDSLVEYLKKKEKENKCELGMHMHGWSNPPYVNINDSYNQPFIFDYPKEVIIKKIDEIDRLFFEKIGHKPISHRSGRWATSSEYLKILSSRGYKFDCSFVSGFNMKKFKGANNSRCNDYSKESKSIFNLSCGITEIPMSFSRIRVFSGFNIIAKIKNFFFGKKIWIRPAIFSFDEMKLVTNKLLKENVTHLEFMIHSSELVPNLNPYIKNKDELDAYLGKIDLYFSFIEKLKLDNLLFKELIN